MPESKEVLKECQKDTEASFPWPHQGQDKHQNEWIIVMDYRPLNEMGDLEFSLINEYIENWWRAGFSHSFKVAPYKILINYREEKSNVIGEAWQTPS